MTRASLPLNDILLQLWTLKPSGGRTDMRMMDIDFDSLYMKWARILVRRLFEDLAIHAQSDGWFFSSLLMAKDCLRK
jgi:hypothetical protein